MSIRKIPYSSHEQWLATRRQYIGGSDAAAVLGMNPYSSPLAVWSEKVGTVEPFEGNIKTQLGSRMEAFVAELFTEKTGKRVRRVNYTLVSDKYPFACANIDREIVGEDSLLECKFTNSRFNVRQFKSGEFPDMWYCQVQHYLAVTGREKAFLAVLSECKDFHVFEIPRDEEDIQAMMEQEEHFWNDYVVPKIQPPADESEATSRILAAMYPSDDGREITLDLDEELLARRKVLKDTEKTIRDELAGIDNTIKQQIGSASTAVCGAYKISFKEQSTSGLDRQKILIDFPTLDFKNYATRARVLRVSAAKEKTA